MTKKAGKKKMTPRNPIDKSLDIRTILIGKINPAKYNPRIDLQPGDPEYQMLKKSIEEFGYVDPLVWNKKTGNLVGGHQRFKILQAEGVKSVECSVVNLSPKKEKMLNLALNKISGDWDYDKLSVVLEELQVAEADFEVCGFEMAEVEEITTNNQEIEEEEVPEVRKKAITKPGDLYILGNHRLLCGDSTRRKDVEKLMDGEKAILMVTDPPYPEEPKGGRLCERYLGKGGWSNIEGDNLNDHDLENMLVAAFSLSDALTIFVWHSWKRIEIFLRAIRQCGWKPVAEIVWVKNSLVFGMADYQWRHETCIYAKRKGAGRQPDRTQTTVWEFPKTTGAEHPTQKPVGLFKIPTQHPQPIKKAGSEQRRHDNRSQGRRGGRRRVHLGDLRQMPGVEDG